MSSHNTVGSTELLQACPGLSYRQLDQWCRAGVIAPAVGALGSGSRRRFHAEQVRIVRLLSELSALGASYRAMAQAALEAGALPEQAWQGVVLVSVEGKLYLQPPQSDVAVYRVDLGACAGHSTADDLVSA